MSNDERPYQQRLIQLLYEPRKQVAETAPESDPNFAPSGRGTRGTSAEDDLLGQQSILQSTSNEALVPARATDDLHLTYQNYQPPPLPAISISSTILPLTYISNDEPTFEDQIFTGQRKTTWLKQTLKPIRTNILRTTRTLAKDNFPDFAAPITQTQCTPLHSEEKDEIWDEAFFDNLLNSQRFTSGEALPPTNYADQLYQDYNINLPFAEPSALSEYTLTAYATHLEVAPHAAESSEETPDEVTNSAPVSNPEDAPSPLPATTTEDVAEVTSAERSPFAEEDHHALQEVTNTITDASKAPSSVSEEAATIHRPMARFEPPTASQAETADKENDSVGPRPVERSNHKRKRDQINVLDAPKAGSSSSRRNTKKSRTKGPTTTPLFSTDMHPAFEATRVIAHPLPVGQSQKRYGWKIYPKWTPNHTASTKDINGKHCVVDPNDIRTWGAESCCYSYSSGSTGPSQPPSDEVDFICLLCPNKIFGTGLGPERMRALNTHFNEVHCTGPRAPCYAKVCPTMFHDSTKRLKNKRKQHLLGTSEKNKQKLHGSKACRKQIAEGNVREGLNVPQDLMALIMAQYQKDLEAHNPAAETQEGDDEVAENTDEDD